MKIKETKTEPKLVPFEQLEVGDLFRIPTEKAYSDVFMKIQDIKCLGLDSPLNFISLEEGVVARLKPTVDVIPCESKPLEVKEVMKDVEWNEN